MTRAGQADIRRLLIAGAMSRLTRLGRRRIAEGSWLGRMLARQPKMLVAIAPAGKMARHDAHVEPLVTVPRACETTTTRMGRPIDDTWLGKTSQSPRAHSATDRFGPDPLITIPARGFRKCRTPRPDRRPHSITRQYGQKLLASRAATTEGDLPRVDRDQL